jgi:hypothetical protein
MVNCPEKERYEEGSLFVPQTAYNCRILAYEKSHISVMNLPSDNFLFLEITEVDVFRSVNVIRVKKNKILNTANV